MYDSEQNALIASKILENTNIEDFSLKANPVNKIKGIIKITPPLTNGIWSKIDQLIKAFDLEYALENNPLLEETKDGIANVDVKLLYLRKVHGFCISGEKFDDEY